MGTLSATLSPDRPIWDSAQDNRLVCRAVIDEATECKTFVLSAPDPARFIFDPGQFLTFSFDLEGQKVERCYSLSSSAANDTAISITVKKVGGGRISPWLFENMRPGVVVHADGPRGNFSAAVVGSRRMLFLSAGSGITPLASMLRTVHDVGADTDIVFLHFVRRRSEIIFSDELQLIARRLANVRLVVVATQPDEDEGWDGPVGRIDGDCLARHVPDLAARTVFCCGPIGFMASAKQLVRSAGVPEGAYYEESFDFTPSPEAIPGDPAGPEPSANFEIRLARAQRTIMCRQDTTLLRAVQAERIPVPSSCGKGVCGTCRTRLISGTVEMHNAGGLKQREIDQGWILPCASKPTSPIVLDR